MRAQSFLAQQHVFSSGYGVDRNYWKGHFVRELPDELLDELLERIVALGRPPGQVLIESLHGAPKDVDPASAALGYRDAAFNISVMAAWPDAALDEQSIQWARATAAALEPWSASGGYMNYMQADEPIERVRAAFGDEAFKRLQTLKQRYDPDNVPTATRTSRRSSGGQAARYAATRDSSGSPLHLLQTSVILEMAAPAWRELPRQSCDGHGLKPDKRLRQTYAAQHLCRLCCLPLR